MAFHHPLPGNSWTSAIGPSPPPVMSLPMLLPAPYKTPDESSNGDTALSQSSPPTPSSTSSGGGKRYRCPRPGCQRSYEKSQTLGRHLRHEHRDCKYKCPGCNAKFKRPDVLKTHRKKKHPPNHTETQDTTIAMPDAGADVEDPLRPGNGPKVSASPEVSPSEQPTPSITPGQTARAVEDGRVASSLAESDAQPPAVDVVMIHGVNNPQAERRSSLVRAGQIAINIDTIFDMCHAKKERQPITTMLDVMQHTYAFSSYKYPPSLHFLFDDYDSPEGRIRSWARIRVINPPHWKTYCGNTGKKLPPPIPGLPEPQDLELLLRHKERMHRFACFMRYFRETHSQFQREYNEAPDLELQCMMDDNVLKALGPHKADFRRAFKNGMTAVRKMLAGILPDDTGAALGIAEVASAMCKLVGEKERSTASEDDFLSDLSRLKIALAPADQVAYDYYTSLLWGDRPAKDVAWQEMTHGENLNYLRDILSKLLVESGFEIVDKKLAELEADVQAHLTDPASMNTCGSTEQESTLSPLEAQPLASRQETSSEHTAQPSLPSISTNSKPAPSPPMLSALVVVAAGAIFGFVLAFVLYIISVIEVSRIRDCFAIANRECSWNMFKYDYLSELSWDSTIAALPTVSAMLSTLLTSCDPLGTVTSIERKLMSQVFADAAFRLDGDDLTSRFQNAMERCSKEARQWLRNSSLDVNCQLLQLLSSS